MLLVYNNHDRMRPNRVRPNRVRSNRMKKQNSIFYRNVARAMPGLTTVEEASLLPPPCKSLARNSPGCGGPAFAGTKSFVL
ncbi:MAG: hypothetical protein WBH03_00565 [Cyclobacteriaceae bacterium]